MRSAARLLSILFLLSSFNAVAQKSTARQKELEVQKQRLTSEIKQINTLLFKNTRKKKDVLSEVEDLNLKIAVRSQLVNVNNQQANLLTRQISVNERDIGNLRKELTALKKDYAEMIRKSYKSKSSQNRLMFLFSSESFLQAYKRIQYMKQYASFRKKQGDEIAAKTTTLQTLNTTLINQKRKKEALVSENRKVQQTLEGERKSQEVLIRSLKKRASSLASSIKQKQKKAAAIDREIERLIREAIAASNKAAGKKSSKAFALTPEARLLAKNFTANKGRLPWPVEKGVVTQRFGTQPHPVVRTTMIKSNGVTIATSPNAIARAVFEGEVMTILSFKGSNPTVLIKHGNYITTYKNIGKLYVKKGEKVKAKQAIGEIFTHPQTGKTILQFSVFNEFTPQDPKSWIYRM
ncbi:peptidoglycan DD-metalloendopeptidase family protein [Flavobacteriaceae bacterium]|nr:peptidoglycan DD-metalloendopeptidase family protein [Flavobacteriaceae bacterium]